MFRIRIVVLLILISAIEPTFASHPCRNDYEGITFVYPLNSVITDFHTDSGDEIYFLMSELSKKQAVKDLTNYLDSAINTQPTSHFVKQLFRALNENPVKYMNFLTNHIDDAKLPQGLIDHQIEKYITLKSKSNGDWMIVLSDFICEVEIIDTAKFENIKLKPFHRILSVKSKLMDSFKGNIDDPDIHFEGVTEYFEKSQKKGEVYFSYCIDWLRGPGDGIIPKYDSNGIPQYKPKLINDDSSVWTEPGDSFIVFLKLEYLCKNGDQIYMNLIPNGYRTLSYGMLPVINGYVIDEGNDFGLGNKVKKDIFVSRLQESIKKLMK